ncbi:hypothetical protein [Cellulosilyticum lentocellum]|uniref:Adhesin domain-containing protein n=1 Tax=Cellulosilyticum lentocellum (strain ATCC 49066 / DSM 5427 / NCIMB 11756 / RHM5) TaxID=642492 RepID=F2JSL2_CELLD|nr:hypothetical protein [Cellulosilyticum lentocellum]ADZ81792.1 hypothetical protein Clole_0030 [Cellulosilyticum lentocellum DSM 5427]
MKKWLIIFSIIFGIGFITSAVIAGQVYYKELNAYTDYDKQDLDINALQSIYIDSQIPVQVEVTQGKPYVEFSQNFTDLLGMAPEFELEVKTKGNSTYVNLEQTKEITVYLGIQEDKASLTVYLPQKAYDTIQIKNNEYSYYSKYRDNNINLEDIDVKKFEIDMEYSEVKLKGSYEQISAHINSGILEIHSNQPAQLEVQGRVKANLTGQYQGIDIQDIENREIYVESEIPTNIKLSSNYSNIKLRGKYDKINVAGYSNSIDAKSDSVCKITVEDESSIINLNGAFKEIALNGERASIDIQTTVIPEYIKLLGYVTEPVNLTLPSNIQGFQVKYLSNNQTEDYYDDYYEDRNKVLSEFDVIEGISPKGEKIYTYGDGSTPITLEADSDSRLEIIDGGYSSEVQ